MADSGKSTLQSILENLRDAAVHFGKRFANPAHVQPELIKLLAELGIDDPLPGRAVSNAMKDAVAAAPYTPIDLRNDPGRRREEEKARREGAELAGQRTERLAALEAQPQTVPVGKRTAEGSIESGPV